MFFFLVSIKCIVDSIDRNRNKIVCSNKAIISKWHFPFIIKISFLLTAKIAFNLPIVLATHGYYENESFKN